MSATSLKSKIAVFSQSSAVTRNVNMKESKLKTNFCLLKLADEEGEMNLNPYFITNSNDQRTTALMHFFVFFV
jgi:hypothetical protein